MACVPATSSPATSINRARPRLASSGLRAPKLERQTCHFYVMPLELSLVSQAALVWGTAMCDFRYGFRREATTAPHSREQDVPSHRVHESPAPSVVTFHRDKARCKPSGRNEHPINRESVELIWKQNEPLDGYTRHECRCQHRCWCKPDRNPERWSIHTGHFENKRRRALTQLSAFQKS